MAWCVTSSVCVWFVSMTRSFVVWFAGHKTKAVDIPLKESIMWNPDIVNDLTEEEGE